MIPLITAMAMPRFKLTTASGPDRVVEFEGVDAVSALNIAASRELAEADLWQDGSYCVTLRREGGKEADFWMIFRKRELSSKSLSPQQDRHRIERDNPLVGCL